MGDNPKPQKDGNKLVDHLSDSDAGDIECTTCGVRFSNGDAYENHMQGKKHQKKVAEAKLKAKNLAADKKKSDEDSDEDQDMHCDVCDKSFTGYMSYISHIKGSVHAKNVKKQKLKEKLGNMPEVLGKNGGAGDDDDDTDDDGILPKLFARCDACQKEFFGPESYEMHTKSTTHKKKVKQIQAVQNLREKYKDEEKTSDGEEPFSKCGVCQKSFSGIMPYNVHMKSSGHKKNLEKKKVAEAMKEFYVEDTGYVCKECKKTFTDPLAFKSHLANNSHEKQKAKSALKEFLNAHPEILFVYPLVDDASGNESDVDDADSHYYLICKLCNVSFSGPESAQDHVKSKKHLIAKKEKKLQKLLKEEKRNSEVKSTDGKSKDSNKDVKSSVISSVAISKNGKSESHKNSPVHNADDFEFV